MFCGQHHLRTNWGRMNQRQISSFVYATVSPDTVPILHVCTIPSNSILLCPPQVQLWQKGDGKWDGFCTGLHDARICMSGVFEGYEVECTRVQVQVEKERGF